MKLTFIADKLPPCRAFVQIALADAEESEESLLYRPAREFAIMPASKAVVSDGPRPVRLCGGSRWLKLSA
jgi:hypothetical protein